MRSRAGQTGLAKLIRDLFLPLPLPADRPDTPHTSLGINCGCKISEQECHKAAMGFVLQNSTGNYPPSEGVIKDSGKQKAISLPPPPPHEQNTSLF